jgi:4-oxalocrotonate tautomerase
MAAGALGDEGLCLAEDLRGRIWPGPKRGSTKMPIVRVEMFRGRTTVMKEFLGRAIVDAVSEIAGPPRENVQVVFSDVGTDEWAIGPTLVSSRPPAPAPAYAPAVMVVESVALKAGKDKEYLAWRRDAVLPFLASQPGFLSSTLLKVGEDAYVVVEKWTNPQAREKSLADERTVALGVEETQFVASRSTELTGGVVDVFRGRS